MKAVIAIFVLLIGVGWFTSTVETSHPMTASAATCDYGKDSWRRTSDGWEDANAWRHFDPPKFDLRAVHPTAVAAFTLFACVGGLVAFSPSRPSQVLDVSFAC